MKKDARCVFVVGRRGSGKTTLTRRLIEPCAAVIAFDPVNQYGTEFRWPVARNIETLHRMVKASWAQGFKIAYTPQSDFIGELHRLSTYLWVAQVGYGPRAQRKVTLMVEEANLSIPVTKLPRGMEGFLQLTLQGRHRGIEIIVVSQRPALVSKDFRSMVAEKYVFPLSEEDDQKAFGRAHARTIAGLVDHEYLHLADSGATRGKNPPLRGRQR